MEDGLGGEGRAVMWIRGLEFVFCGWMGGGRTEFG